MSQTPKRILVAVDDSQPTTAAVDHGIALAARDGAELVFAHVSSILGDDFVPDAGDPARVPTVSTTPSLQAAADRAAAAGVTCRLELLVGYAPRQLALLAEDLDVDLVVVGSRHLTGLKRTVLGSTSRALVEECTRPVLIVPPTQVAEPVSVS